MQAVLLGDRLEVALHVLAANQPNASANQRIAGVVTATDAHLLAPAVARQRHRPRLAERMDQQAGTLSGGEQQMLAVARGLMSQPRLLMLDEPSMGVAPVIKAVIFDALADIARDEGVTMLIVEQDAELALDLADRGYVLETGSLAVQGPAEALLADDALRRAYLGG